MKHLRQADIAGSEQVRRALIERLPRRGVSKRLAFEAGVPLSEISEARRGNRLSPKLAAALGFELRWVPKGEGA